MRLHNTLTRSVDELVPREAGRVGLYVCGPTVQGPPHFGHARAALVPDLLRRYLEWTGVEVLHVRNITDIDDKIIERAAEEGVQTAVLTERYTRIWDRDIGRLGVLPPHVAPRATGHVPEMIELIAQLVERGAAYPVDGDVMFAVRSFERYGALSGRDPDDLRAGARVAADERKRDPLDFALWKAAKPGEPSWPSPWGRGRPGWHIECSAMATRYLGGEIDLHMGGTELIFPHHENEIAQWEAATGTTFVRHWVHNGLLTLGGEKMSKSVGNVLALDEAIERHGADTIRMFFLRVHYRSLAELSEERLAEAGAAVERLTAFLRAAAGAGEAPELDPPAVGNLRAAFATAMDDDLSTPRALAAIFDLVALGNRANEAGDRSLTAAARAAVEELSGVLGLALDDADRSADADLLDGLVHELLALRSDARDHRDFATADRIRERLAGLGVVVEDTSDGARWHLVRG